MADRSHCWWFSFLKTNLSSQNDVPKLPWAAFPLLIQTYDTDESLFVCFAVQYNGQMRRSIFIWIQVLKNFIYACIERQLLIDSWWSACWMGTEALTNLLNNILEDAMVKSWTATPASPSIEYELRVDSFSCTRPWNMEQKTRQMGTPELERRLDMVPRSGSRLYCGMASGFYAAHN